eukprot:symbB.v1.2.038137.t1/scaffold5840.1/size23231/2
MQLLMESSKLNEGQSEDLKKKLAKEELTHKTLAPRFADVSWRLPSEFLSTLLDFLPVKEVVQRQTRSVSRWFGFTIYAKS